MPAGTKEHRYTAAIVWSGNRGTGTSSYRAYGRDHQIASGDKPAIAGSSDPAFRGDGTRWNPEDLLVSALSACHMLTYLHLCAVGGIAVVAYEDSAEGTMRESGDGGGRFTGVVLRPRVSIASGDPGQAARLHEEAHRLCFVAASVDFPVRCEPEIVDAKERD